MFKIALFSALLAVALAADIPFEACEGWPKPTSVSIPECGAVPCGFVNGDSFTVNFTFDAEEEFTEMPVVVTIENNGIVSEFPLPTGDACAAVAGGCPVPLGPNVASFPLTVNDLASGESIVTVEICDEHHHHVACAKVSAFFN